MCGFCSLNACSLGSFGCDSEGYGSSCNILLLTWVSVEEIDVVVCCDGPLFVEGYDTFFEVPVFSVKDNRQHDGEYE